MLGLPHLHSIFCAPSNQKSKRWGLRHMKHEHGWQSFRLKDPWQRNQFWRQFFFWPVRKSSCWRPANTRYPVSRRRWTSLNGLNKSFYMKEINARTMHLPTFCAWRLRDLKTFRLWRRRVISWRNTYLNARDFTYALNVRKWHGWEDRRSRNKLWTLSLQTFHL